MSSYGRQWCGWPVQKGRARGHVLKPHATWSSATALVRGRNRAVSAGCMVKIFHHSMSEML